MEAGQNGFTRLVRKVTTSPTRIVTKRGSNPVGVNITVVVREDCWNTSVSSKIQTTALPVKITRRFQLFMIHIIHFRAHPDSANPPLYGIAMHRFAVIWHRYHLLVRCNQDAQKNSMRHRQNTNVWVWQRKWKRRQIWLF